MDITTKVILALATLGLIAMFSMYPLSGYMIKRANEHPVQMRCFPQEDITGPGNFGLCPDHSRRGQENV